MHEIIFFYWWAVWNCAPFVVERDSFYESASFANFSKTRNGNLLIFSETATATHSKECFLVFAVNLFRAATAIRKKTLFPLLWFFFETRNNTSIKKCFSRLCCFSRTATAIHSKKFSRLCCEFFRDPQKKSFKKLVSLFGCECYSDQQQQFTPEK